MKRILIIEDNLEIAELERDFLRLAKKLQLLSPQGSDAEGEKP